MTREELKQYNGQNGAKAYIAYKNVIYDVTDSPLWEEGSHQDMHFAGVDLTEQLADAPHSDDVFEEFPVVGTLQDTSNTPKTQQTLKITKQKKAPQTTFKVKLREWYKSYHPHPMAVHFPIALHLFAAGMDLAFLLMPNEAYDAGVFYSFFIATFMGLVAMIPGILSWWVNYNFSMHKAFVIKLVVSVLTLLLGVVAIGIYYENPHAVYESSFEGILYHAIVLITGLNVIVLGYYGGRITWGYAKHSTLNGQKTQKLSHIEESRTTISHTRMGKSISILIGGAAGSGIDTLEKILSSAFKNSGYYLFSTKEFMSRVRGGSNTVLLRISEIPIEAPCWEVDISIAIDAPSLQHMRPRWRKDTVVLADESFAQNFKDVTPMAVKEGAKKFGKLQYANSYIAGALFALLKINKDILLESITEHFKNDTSNKDVANLGYEEGLKLEIIKNFTMPDANPHAVEKLHLMDGTTSSGFGFLAGGCNMITAYPMSPSTGLLNFMASMGKEFDIALEQSEDEIASLHMVLGGWYAGARAMTSTSGGGFALMGEALSLAGMSETPAVIYLAQRPGPATGLPTRSEQGDLNMAIHSGHGPFSRIVLAPGDLQECIDCGYSAFELADRFQAPVIFLIDQYLADSIAMIDGIDFSSYEQRRHITKTEQSYERYTDVQDGISPRGIPGFGDGLVCSVGDEHDERGQITEDYKMREKMVAKRECKNEQIVKEAVKPQVFGEGDIAVVGWGSTKGAINEALQNVNDPRLAQVHFSWVYPLSHEQTDALKNYSHIIVIENNADAAFTKQLKLLDVKVDHEILQSNGFSFFADQLSEMLKERLKEIG